MLEWIKSRLGLRSGPQRAAAERTQIRTDFDSVEDGTFAHDEALTEWEVGDVIDNLYEVKYVFDTGGMGVVHRVHHRRWNIDLAIKSPRRQFFHTQEQKDSFINECRTWIDLGLHPNIATCYYVRELAGIPRVFAEFVDGGTLADWIESRRLYTSSENGALARMLDVGIQFAWGLDYAHKRGVVHCDVKPSNVLVTDSFQAKVTDFGLSRALGQSGLPTPEPGQSFSPGWLTPAYSSPEQLNGRPLSKRTDLWSWGVSLLEMFIGDVTWRSGVAAPEILDEYLKTGPVDSSIPRMPEAVVDLLRECFRKSPEQRPESLLEIATAMTSVYQTVAGPYHRRVPQAGTHSADELNNHALSFMDLGLTDNALREWEQALAQDPNHVDTLFNRGAVLWRTAAITDEDLLDTLITIAESPAAEERRRTAARVYAGLINAERGDWNAARAIVSGLAERDTSNTDDPLVQHLTDLVEKNRSLVSTSTPIVHWMPNAHSAEVSAMHFRDNGDLVTGGADGVVKLWSSNGYTLIRQFEGHANKVNVVQFVPGMPYCVFGGHDGKVCFWDLATGELGIFARVESPVLTITVSPQLGLLILGEGSGEVSVWDLDTAGMQWQAKRHDSPVVRICLSGNSRSFASQDFDGHIIQWDHTTKEPVAEYDATSSLHWTLDDDYVTLHNRPRWARGRSRAISWVVDRACLIDNSKNTSFSLRLFDTSTMRCRMSLICGYRTGTKQYERKVTSAIADASGSVWAVGLADGSFVAGKLSRPDSESPAPYAISRVRAPSSVFSAREIVLDSVERAGQALEEGDSVRAKAFLEPAIPLADGQSAVQVYDLWDRLTSNGKRTSLLRITRIRTVNTAGPLDLCQIPGSGLTLSSRNGIQIWDLKHGANPVVNLAESKAATAFQVSGGETVLAIVGNYIRAWTVREGNCAWTSDRHNLTQTALAISPDSRFAATGTHPGGIFIWTLGATTCRCVDVLVGHEARVFALLIASDNLVISAADDRTIRVWDIVTRQCVHTISVPGSIGCLALNPEGTAVAFACGDILFIKDIETYTAARALATLPGRIDHLAFTADGRFIMTAASALSIVEVVSGRVQQMTDSDRPGSFSLSKDSRWLAMKAEPSELWRLIWDCRFRVDTSSQDDLCAHVRSIVRQPSGYVSDDPMSDDALLPIDHASLDCDYAAVESTLAERGFGPVPEERIRAVVAHLMKNGNKQRASPPDERDTLQLQNQLRAKEATDGSPTEVHDPFEFTLKIIRDVPLTAGDWEKRDDQIDQLVNAGPRALDGIHRALQMTLATSRAGSEFENAGLVCESVGRIGTGQALDVLVHYASTKSNMWDYRLIREGAIRGLGHLDAPGVVSVLKQLSRHFPESADAITASLRKHEALPETARGHGPRWAARAASWKEFGEAFVNFEVGKSCPDYESLRKSVGGLRSQERHGIWKMVGDALHEKHDFVGALQCFIEALYNDSDPAFTTWRMLNLKLSGTEAPELRAAAAQIEQIKEGELRKEDIDHVLDAYRRFIGSPGEPSTVKSGKYPDNYRSGSGWFCCELRGRA